MVEEPLMANLSRHTAIMGVSKASHNTINKEDILMVDHRVVPVDTADILNMVVEDMVSNSSSKVVPDTVVDIAHLSKVPMCRLSNVSNSSSETLFLLRLKLLPPVVVFHLPQTPIDLLRRSS